uniref:BSD domain-containing protein n=1 Tax=Angiostrongylus cantonensis TaxID=6313 RepID=A0A158PB40_ANGCA
MAYGQRKGFENLPALNLEDCSVIPKKIPSTVIDRLNHFMDPFEEERRLSRTEAKVVEVPEKSVSTSPPCNTTTSTTGVDEELSPAVRAHKNEDLLPNVKIPKIELSRMKSSTTSEKSESNSLVSSDLDKTSIVKLRFNCNLHRAREDAKREVDMNAFDRFWRYYYKKNDTTDGATGSSQSERKDSCRNRHHGHPSTIDRVVMYYTSTRRPSATPSLSLLSHSSEPPTERSHHSDAGADLFVQRRKCMLAVQQDPLTSEPSGNTAMSHDKTSTHCMSDTSSNSDELIGNGHFFLLSETSGSEPALLRPSTFSRATRDLLEDKSTSTADLDPSILDISSSDRRGLENTYKRTVRDKSTVTSPMLDYIETSSKKEMRDQMTSTSSSFLSSSSLPVVVLEDTPEMDASLPDFKDQLTDLESSSMEDLLAIDTRPSSSNRKSVTFGDTIDIDVVAQEYRMRSPSPDNRHITVKPILKKEDKQRESMRRLLGYVAERLYKDLLMLVEERDRSIHALELTSSDQDAVVFSVNSTIFQQVWSKLKDMALDGAAAQFVNGVRHSSELTLNVKRRLLDKRESHPVTHRKPRSEFEMACDFSRRLSQIREQMVRRDSETFDDNRSMEELMCAMSRIMTG